MGIVFGQPWSAYCTPERNEVCVNLSGLKAPIPYHFQHQSGSIMIPFNLGRHFIQLGDLIELARGEIPLMARVEVDATKKVHFPGNVELDPATVDRLAVGISQPIAKQISHWHKIRRLDTDLGFVVIEVRLVFDVVGILKLGFAPQSWFSSRQESMLVGEAEGSIEVYVRARFEREDERWKGRFIAGAAATIVTIPILLFSLLRLLTHENRQERLPPASFDSVAIPATHKASSSGHSFDGGNSSRGGPTTETFQGSFSS